MSKPHSRQRKREHPMTTICKTAIRLSGLSLIAALMLTSLSATVEAKELCLEECTFFCSVFERDPN
jgi:hypothetical protein